MIITLHDESDDSDNENILSNWYALYSLIFKYFVIVEFDLSACATYQNITKRAVGSAGAKQWSIY